tara:strand:+ start:29289 stop:29894 length:606 start_codon:yes stop_codon:yes gene_type:complete
VIPSDIKSYYKLHSKFYDISRWAFLFGRNSIPKFFPKLKSGSRVLDLGCGTGKHLQQLTKKYPNCEIIGLDQSEYMLEFINPSIYKSVHIKNEVYSQDSFEDNSFDLVLCSYSLTMFDDIWKTIPIIKSHLKPTGKLLVVDFDATPFNWFSKWMKRNHVSFEPNLFELLKNSFDVEKMITKKGYLDLYTYSALIAESKKSS